MPSIRNSDYQMELIFGLFLFDEKLDGFVCMLVIAEFGDIWGGK
jgi:hypothetical protein